MKFGTSSSEKQQTPTTTTDTSTPSPAPASPSTSTSTQHSSTSVKDSPTPRQSTDSRNTISVNNLADDVSKLTVAADRSPEKAWAPIIKPVANHLYPQQLQTPPLTPPIGLHHHHHKQLHYWDKLPLGRIS